MLKRLLIRNLVTIEKAVFEPGEGFCVLTGETGAGKSIVLKAIALLMGVKASKSLVRSGESTMVVEGVFDLTQKPDVLTKMEEYGLVPEKELIVRRQIQKNGGNRVFINDQASSNQVLSELVGNLLDMHSQHAQQALMSVSSHIHFLDQFAGLNGDVRNYTQKYQHWISLKKQWNLLNQDIEDRNRQIDFLTFQIHEIQDAGFTQEEESELLLEHKKLQHKERLSSLLAPIFEWEGQDLSPLSQITSALSTLKEAVSLDESLSAGIELFESAVINLDEGVRDINNYREQLEFSEEKVEQINERLSELDKLKRKYGSNVSEIEKFAEKLQQELQGLNSFDENKGKVEREMLQQEKQVLKLAEELSGKRKNKSKELAEKVKESLFYLGLENSDFELDLKRLKTPVSDGIDTVTFLFTANPGHPLQTLSQIASGGEMSRVMLALKVSTREGNKTMVFDEIDSGVSGGVASHVGEKLLEVSMGSQVICITHSPQVAALADTHWRVSKLNQQESTFSKLQLLDEKGRIEEIAQFIGGNVVSKKAYQMASEMLGKPV